MVKIELKRTGFPVEIGNVELWFDSSMENLRRFVNIDEIAKERLTEVSERAKHVHFPKEITDETVEEIPDKDIDEAFSINKEFIAIQYDIMFGDGAFKKIYKEHPDLAALEDALDIVGAAITEKIEEFASERAGKYEKEKLKLIEKKKKKATKK